jgi:hypothetical protein
MGRRIESFCEIRVEKKYSKEKKDGYSDVQVHAPMRDSLYISLNYCVCINYGDGKGWNWLQTIDGKEYTCDSQAEAMNYMSKQGWKMIKNYIDSDLYTYYKYLILFKKDIYIE